MSLSYFSRITDRRKRSFSPEQSSQSTPTAVSVQSAKLLELKAAKTAALQRTVKKTPKKQAPKKTPKPPLKTASSKPPPKKPPVGPEAAVGSRQLRSGTEVIDMNSLDGGSAAEVFVTDSGTFTVLHNVSQPFSEQPSSRAAEQEADKQPNEAEQVDP